LVDKPVSGSGSDFQGWIPIGFEWRGSHPSVDWCYLKGIGFTEPFFENTLQRAMQDPARLLFRRLTPIETLLERAVSHPGMSPTGFIFHMSRCGSTLISQMFAASKRNLSISEGWAVESVLSADLRHPGVTSQDRILWLRGVAHALGQPQQGTDRYFIKFDATHTLDLPLIRVAFPKVPWVFLYRNPVEVMVSQAHHRAYWTMPGIVPVRGVPLTPAAFADHDEYLADLLLAICQAAFRHAHEPGAMLLNYTELPDAVYGRLARHFGCTWTGDEIEAMKQASSRDAKAPATAFAPDSERKRQDAGEHVNEICERKLGAVYRELEAVRRRQT
jgi:hypothetical protein